MSNPTNQQAKILVLKALMITSPPQGTLVGAHVEDTPDVVRHRLMQPFGESPSHEGFQEHTHSSPTPGSLSAESASEIFASTLNASKVVDQIENHVEAFKRIFEN